jgi:tRNA threonylcarbamoyladenosine biosynthesis protein TsaB
MPLILNIETATDICSIGLAQEGQLLSLQESSEGYQHASQITLLIEQCMKEAGCRLSEIDAVAVSTGPGSYTSLRVGTSTAKGICYALDKPLIAVNTLQSLALASREGAASPNSLFCPMIDARRMEVYTALFDGQLREVRPLQALIVEENSFDIFFEKNIPILFSGNGAPKCKEVIRHPLATFSDQICSARHLFPLAAKHYQQGFFVDIAHYTPNYFKAPNITKPRKIL